MATFLITGVTLGDTSIASDGLRVTNAANSATTFGIGPLDLGPARVNSGENGGNVTLDLSGPYGSPPGSAVAMVFSGSPMVIGELGDVSAFGSHGVANMAQAAYPGGIFREVFGPSVRANAGGEGNELMLNLSGQYESPTALNVGMYLDGKPLVSMASVGELSAFGMGKVTAPIAARPPGIAPGTVQPPISVNRGENGGDVLLDLTGTYVAPVGTAVSMSLSGPPLVIGSIGDTSAFGAASFRNAAQAAYPVGVLPGMFGPATRATASAAARQIAMELSGNYAPPSASSIQMVWAGTDKSASPSAIDSLAFGPVSLVNVSQGLFAEGFDAAAVTVPKIAQTFPIMPGTDFARYGNAHVELRLTVAGAKGFVDTSYGKPWVSYFLRNLTPDGIKHDAYGKPIMQGGVRNAPMNGFGTFAAGRAVVTLASRQVFPGWFVDTRYGKPMMGYDRTFTMTGFDAARWGDALVWDNTQRTYPPGLDATRWGDAWADRYTRSVTVKRFDEDDLSNIGFPRIFNLNRYITANYIADQWNEGGVGDYQAMSVRNVNRTIDLVRNGIAPTFRQIPLEHEVRNGARQMRAHGFDATAWGERRAEGGTFIAPGVRSVFPVGFLPVELSSRFHVVRNSAMAPRTVGWDGAAFGKPSRVVNTRRYFSGFRVGQTDAWGLPFIAPRVRSVGPQKPLEPVRGIVGAATVWFLNRDVTPKQPPFGWGGFGPVLVEGFPIPNARVKSITPTWRWGVGRVWNRTPEVTPYWETRLFTTFGANAIFNRNNFFPLDGWESLQFGRNTIITYRTKRVGPYGLNALRDNPKHSIRNVLPDPPGQQYAIGCTLGGTLKLGAPEFQTLALWPNGITPGKFGDPKLQGMSIFPVGIPPFISDNGTQFGMPAVPGQQKIGPKQIPDDPNFKGGYFGSARMTPWTIWAPVGAPDQAKKNNPGNEELVDAYLDRTTSARPFWGRARVELKNRIVHHRASTITERFGTARFSRDPQYATPDGMKVGKYGYPVLWGGNLSVLQAGFDLSAFGKPALTQVEPFIRYLRPSAVASAAFGATWVANFIRYPGITGFNAMQPGKTWIHPPPPPAKPHGLDATLWGRALPADGMFIAYRNRPLDLPGFDSFVSDYTLGAFDARLWVHGRTIPRDVSLGVQSVLGRPNLDAKDRSITVHGLVPASRPVSRPSLRKQNRVNLVSAGAAGEWGEAWAMPVQKGRVHTRGDEWLTFGAIRASYAMFGTGWRGMMGDARISQPVRTNGRDEAQFGQTILMGFGCGLQVRAMMGMDSGTFGDVRVNEVVS